jgi:hypothetical protein
MWNMIPSLVPIVAGLVPAFTQPSAVTACQLLLAWVMCLGRHTLRRAAQNAHPDRVPDHSRRHGLDTYYNFFERSAWTPRSLAHRVGILPPHPQGHRPGPPEVPAPQREPQRPRGDRARGGGRRKVRSPAEAAAFDHEVTG